MARSKSEDRKKKSANFNGLTALIADSSENFTKLLTGMLVEFRLSQILTAQNGEEAMRILSGKQIDIAFLDCILPETDGFAITKSIREKSGPNQMIPILILTSHTQIENVTKARDCGANMVLAKPVSAGTLFDRLFWAAENPREFVTSDNYFGPDRRFKIEGYPGGVGRRESDNIEVGRQTEPDLQQDEIDALFK